MRAEKQILSKEYAARLNASPFFIVVDYRGLKVGPITELRKRLLKAGAEMHVVKNSRLPPRGEGGRHGRLGRLVWRGSWPCHRPKGHFRGGEDRQEIQRRV